MELIDRLKEAYAKVQFMHRASPQIYVSDVFTIQHGIMTTAVSTVAKKQKTGELYDLAVFDHVKQELRDHPIIQAPLDEVFNRFSSAQKKLEDRYASVHRIDALQTPARHSHKYKTLTKGAQVMPTA